MNPSSATTNLDFTRTFGEVVDQVVSSNLRVGDNARPIEDYELARYKRGGTTHVWIWKDNVEVYVRRGLFKPGLVPERVTAIIGVLYLTHGPGQNVASEWRLDFYGKNHIQVLNRLGAMLTQRFGVTVNLRDTNQPPVH